MTDHQSAEIRHLLRKHVLHTNIAGKAQTVKCWECNRTGADTPDNILHKTSCRYAAILKSLGEDVRVGSAKGGTKTTTKKEPVIRDPLAVLEECSS